MVPSTHMATHSHLQLQFHGMLVPPSEICGHQARYTHGTQTWSKMLVALGRGAIKSKEGTVEAFLFRAMLDRLLEEFHALESE